MSTGIIRCPVDAGCSWWVADGPNAEQSIKTHTAAHGRNAAAAERFPYTAERAKAQAEMSRELRHASDRRWPEPSPSDTNGWSR